MGKHRSTSEILLFRPVARPQVKSQDGPFYPPFMPDLPGQTLAGFWQGIARHGGPRLWGWGGSGRLVRRQVGGRSLARRRHQVTLEPWPGRLFQRFVLHTVGFRRHFVTRPWGKENNVDSVG